MAKLLAYRRSFVPSLEWEDWLTSDQRWSHLSTLIAIRSHTQEVGSEKTSEETRYYISSVNPLPTAL